MKHKLVCISWIDADGESGWSPDDPKKDAPIIMKTYGLLVRKTKDWVIHASTYDPDSKHWADKGKIPTGMVKSVKVISVVES